MEKHISIHLAHDLILYASIMHVLPKNELRILIQCHYVCPEYDMKYS